MTGPTVHISSTSGHHPSYQQLFVRLWRGVPSTGSIWGPRFFALVSAPQLFFCTIDAEYAGFMAVALLRALRRRPTAGLFLRPLQCFETRRRIVFPLKRRVFRWLCGLPGLRILSIIPHDIHPQLREVSHGWIYDPQMWDLWIDGAPTLPDTDLSRRVEAERGARRVLIFIGTGNAIKGFADFAAHAAQSCGDVLAVVAGQVRPEYGAALAELRALGMIVEDRHVTDEEILSLYKVADLAWCRYAPDYDQASGVFGRALQTGVTPIVRSGSLLDHILRKYSPEDGTAAAPPPATAQSWRDRSLEQLNASLPRG